MKENENENEIVLEPTIEDENEYEDKYETLFEPIVKTEKEIDNEIIAETLETIVKKMKEISIDRPFDMLDYYDITSIPLSKMFNYTTKFLNADDSRLFNNTLAPNKFCKSISVYEKELTYSGIEQLLDLEDEINCKRDDKGFPIPGTGIVISREEKEKLFADLYANNYPVSKITYDAAYKRYASNLEKGNFQKR